MRRRLTAAIVGMVIAALVLTGVGTLTLAAVNDRADTENDLRAQVETLSDLFVELTIVPRSDEDGLGVRERLQAMAESISVQGIGLLILPRNGADPIGELPDGVSLDQLDVEALQAGETVSSRDGDRIWAAKGSTNRAGVPQLLVLTQEPDPILIPAFRWFMMMSWAFVGSHDCMGPMGVLSHSDDAMEVLSDHHKAHRRFVRSHDRGSCGALSDHDNVHGRFDIRFVFRISFFSTR